MASITMKKKSALERQDMNKEEKSDILSIIHVFRGDFTKIYLLFFTNRHLVCHVVQKVIGKIFRYVLRTQSNI